MKGGRYSTARRKKLGWTEVKVNRTHQEKDLRGEDLNRGEGTATKKEQRNNQTG